MDYFIISPAAGGGGRAHADPGIRSWSPWGIHTPPAAKVWAAGPMKLAGLVLAALSLAAVALRADQTYKPKRKPKKCNPRKDSAC